MDTGAQLHGKARDVTNWLWLGTEITQDRALDALDFGDKSTPIHASNVVQKNATFGRYRLPIQRCGFAWEGVLTGRILVSAMWMLHFSLPRT